MHSPSVATANPPARFTKAECLVAFEKSAWFARLDALQVVGGNVLAETILGNIIVTNEVLGELAEGERRFILAHELGHVMLGHWRHMEMLYEKWVPGPAPSECTVKARCPTVAAPMRRERTRVTTGGSLRQG